jgi:argininosuccinate synthase
MKKKVVLAYSGGLDTSFCCIYLTQDLGMEVHSVIVNTGGFSKEELDNVEKRAYQMGVTSHHVVDETINFYNTCIRYLTYGNVLKTTLIPYR